jgi:broad specificity phosphatase PhoE
MGAEEGNKNDEHPRVKERVGSGRSVVVHIVRHGEIASYRPDAGLTEKGRRQSFEAGKQLVARIGEGEMVKFITSPFQRAQESNEAMIEGLNEAIREQGREDIKVYTSRRERRLRALDHKDDSQLRELSRRGEDTIGYWLRDLISEKEVESPSSVLDRVQEFVGKRQKISQRLPGGPTIHYICVTHSPVMRALLKDAFGKDLGEPEMGESVELLFAPGKDPRVKFRDEVS